MAIDVIGARALEEGAQGQFNLKERVKGSILALFHGRIWGLREEHESAAQLEEPDLALDPSPPPVIYEEGAFNAAVARYAERIRRPGPDGAAYMQHHISKVVTLEEQLLQYSSSPRGVPAMQVHATREQLHLQYAILNAAEIEYPPPQLTASV